MNVYINVKQLCEYAMFEEDGIRLREEIVKLWNENAENIVVLDFKGVDMFATMFFNASIGWLILHYGEENVNSRIQTENLNQLGDDTWKHSYDNAIEVSKDPQYKKILSELDTNADD